MAPPLQSRKTAVLQEKGVPDSRDPSERSNSLVLERHTRVELDDVPRQRHAQERAIGVGRRRHGRGDRAEVT